MARVTHLAHILEVVGFSFCEPYMLDWVSPLAQDPNDHLFTQLLWEADCRRCLREAGRYDLPVKNVPDNGLVHLPSRVGLPWCGASIPSDPSQAGFHFWLKNALVRSVQGAVDLSVKIDRRVLIRGKAGSQDVHHEDAISCPDCRAKLESHGGGQFIVQSA